MQDRGWICPVCEKGKSPQLRECSCVVPKTVKQTIDIAVQPGAEPVTPESIIAVVDDETRKRSRRRLSSGSFG